MTRPTPSRRRPEGAAAPGVAEAAGALRDAAPQRARRSAPRPGAELAPTVPADLAARLARLEQQEALRREAARTLESAVANVVGFMRDSRGRAETHAALFTRAFPGVKVNVVRATAQVAYQRLSQDIQAGAAKSPPRS